MGVDLDDRSDGERRWIMSRDELVDTLIVVAGKRNRRVMRMRMESSNIFAEGKSMLISSAVEEGRNANI